eukprot:1161981-Pelagomonas_calceolata.AAC.12
MAEEDERALEGYPTYTYTHIHTQKHMLSGKHLYFLLAGMLERTSWVLIGKSVCKQPSHPQLIDLIDIYFTVLCVSPAQLSQHMGS